MKEFPNNCSDRNQTLSKEVDRMMAGNLKFHEFYQFLLSEINDKAYVL
jgi:hypothetical protein